MTMITCLGLSFAGIGARKMALVKTAGQQRRKRGTRAPVQGAGGAAAVFCGLPTEEGTADPGHHPGAHPLSAPTRGVQGASASLPLAYSFLLAPVATHVKCP